MRLLSGIFVPFLQTTSLPASHQLQPYFMGVRENRTPSLEGQGQDHTPRETKKEGSELTVYLAYFTHEYINYGVY